MNLQKSVKVGLALKGGSQEELALFLEKSPATVSKYLNGKIDPPFSVVLTMCEYFKVPMNSFCGWSE
jgi:transcriptional regulator with XRE-family HTH domain